MEWNKLLNPERPRESSIPDDHRVQFERDFDRAVFSNPVKRLQDKAQVFPLEPIDAVRTRLTHSLEVSCVARGIARAVADWLLEKKHIDQNQDRSIEAIAATCGLIHDLGNPPFGHAGEAAIQSWFSSNFGLDGLSKRLTKDKLAYDFLRFEGNAQSLRLITKLQILADYNGLNLTFGTLSASCKYIAAAHEANGKSSDHARTKPGYFASESDVVKQMREETGTGIARNPIAYLVEAADDIVYSVADVEDGIKKGILSWQSLRDIIEGFNDEHFREALESMTHILNKGNIPEGRIPDDVKASAFRTTVIRLSVDSVAEAFKAKYDEIMNGTYRGELVKDGRRATLVKRLKEVGRQRIYCTPPTLKLELMGKRIIRDLMDIFWEGAEALPLGESPITKDFPGKAGALLSENYRRVFQHFAGKKDSLPESYYRFQLLTDYVCGMTDSFAKRMHSELVNG